MKKEVNLKFEDLKKSYTDLWNTIIIKPDFEDRAKLIANKIALNKSRYGLITEATGVPWFMVGMLHNMECGLNFDFCLMNGQPLNKITTMEPKGHGPWNTWEQSAIDAIRYDNMDDNKDWSIEKVLFYCESFNGWGYRLFHPTVNSPYVWSGSNLYRIGKYDVDSHFNPNIVSDQVGCALILKKLNCFEAIDYKDCLAKFPSPSRKAVHLQLILNLLGGKLIADGFIGPKTLADIDVLSQDTARQVCDLCGMFG